MGGGGSGVCPGMGTVLSRPCHILVLIHRLGDQPGGLAGGQAPQFLAGAQDVGVDGGDLDAQLIGDLAAEPFALEQQHGLALTLGEPGEAGCGSV